MVLSTNFEINNRTIYIDPEIKDIVVQGDTNSKTIIFNLRNRFFDGIDLSSKPIKIGYQNALGKTDYEDAYLNTIDLESFTFSWTLSGNIAVKDGTVNIFVEFQEVNSSDEKVYVWKTKPITFNVEPTFEVLGNATSLDYTAQQLFYSNNDNNTLSSIGDTNEPIYIDNRRILIPILEDLVVSGDNKSQIISFTMPRYFENVDLSQKVISIKFINAQGQGDRTRVVNLTVTETDITFGWLIDSKATIKDGYVQFAIEFFGYENGEWYCWSTVPAQFEVSKGLDVDGLVEAPLPSWIQSFELQASDLLAQKTNEIDNVISNVSNQFQVKYDGLETEYSTELNMIKSSLSDINSQFDNVVANVTVDSEIILARGEYDTLYNRLDTNDEKINTKIDLATIDTQSGTSVQSTVADDFIIEFKINGATTVTPANPDLDVSPDNVAVIESAKDFDVVACGKNLFDKSIQTKGWYNSEGVLQSSVVWYLREQKVNPNEKITFSGISYNVAPYICGRQSDGVVIPIRPINNTTIDTGSYTSIIYSINQDHVETAQVEINATATAYEPYKSNKITISHELRSLPNGVKDTIEYIGNGKGKLVQRVGKEVFDGSDDEGWIAGDNTLANTLRVAFKIPSDMAKAPNNIDIICNRFKPSLVFSVDAEGIFAGSDTVYLRINKSRLNSLDSVGVREWVQTNPLEFLYELATPIETIIDLPLLTSYKGITNVYTTANPQVEITANFKSRLKNTYEVLLSKIEKLTNAIIQLGGTV